MASGLDEGRKNILATRRNKSHTLLFTLLFTNWLLSPNHSSCSIKQLYCCRIRQIRYCSCLNMLELQMKFMIIFICTSCLGIWMIYRSSKSKKVKCSNCFGQSTQPLTFNHCFFASGKGNYTTV